MARGPRFVPLPGPLDEEDQEGALNANRVFYRAFNERDFGLMEEMWAHTAAVSCLHPGQHPLYDRAAIVESWRRILAGSGSTQVRISDERVLFARGGLALVTCRELLPQAPLIATNGYVKEAGAWRIVHHHSGQTPPPATTQTQAPAAKRDRRRLH
jgi:hypothetical protein